MHDRLLFLKKPRRNCFPNIGRKNIKLAITFDKMDSIAIRSCTLICLMSAAFNAILRIVELILEPGYWFGIAIAQCANGEPLIRMAFLNKPETSVYDLMK